VPPGDPERNDAPTLAAWRAGGELPAHVHPMPAEQADLDAAASAYARTLRDATDGGPLDACLIGMGEDGHCASLFPNHPGLRELADVFAVSDSPKPPPRRLTLSLPVLHRARLRLVLVLGAAKGAIAARAQRGPDPMIPVSLLPRESTIWAVDDAALTTWRATAG
jgi:6-phosphogluconolactonase